ncbi:flagellar basal body-associated FliL family protein [Ligilactobacillus agilis]|uniref:flagellar basal body-associated FliL family protein n=1 Tax=Ligilactobacillus agilis TaxID=1601 RepID=UPI001DA86489|nr:flagellar basal body-associated FliL family protein [Ligilactobacillus agilis]MDM8279938.1 flagellar basal body-associated FliL family protein [Ligilactobacillus agilis]HJG06212.1 flagellar basal body-associated FliL family protein [Ligilactobacillus agilis]
MAKKAPKTEEQPEATPKKKGNKLVLILAFILLAAAFGFGGSYLANKYILPKKAEAAKNDKTTISKDEVLVPISKFVVNLSGNSNNNYQYIRLKVSCLVADKDASENLTKSMPLVRDSVISVLNSKTANDLLEANEGINNLKTAIKDKINQEYGQTIVKQVYITDLVIQ